MTLMKTWRENVFCIVAGGFLAVSVGSAVAQNASDEEAPAAVEEDTSWQDKSVRQLRREYRAAEEAFYAAFNEINTDDEFDMDCRTAPRLGSRKRERRCQAEFLWEYEEELAEEMYRRSSTGAAGSATTSQARLQRKQEELRAEMNAAIADYPAVGAAFAELQRSKRHYDLKMAED